MLLYPRTFTTDVSYMYCEKSFLFFLICPYQFSVMLFFIHQLEGKKDSFDIILNPIMYIFIYKNKDEILPKLSHTKIALYFYFILFQFNLVCNRKWYVTLTQSMFMLGQMLGVFSSGLIADRYFISWTKFKFSFKRLKLEFSLISSLANFWVIFYYLMQHGLK
jgi:hypothetical protein